MAHIVLSACIMRETEIKDIAIIFTFDQLAEIRRAGLPDDHFGPDSQHLSICVTLEGRDIDETLANWLVALPCPVVGVLSAADMRDVADMRDIKASGILHACDAIVGEQQVTRLQNSIARSPLAAMTLCQQLRLAETLPLEQALITESLAYASLQKGREFNRWLAAQPDPPSVSSDETPDETPDEILLVTRQDAILQLCLNAPAQLNEIDVAMRDALCAAFDIARLDDKISGLALSANGKAFSQGGALSEFGEVADPATAHWIRMLRLPALHLIRSGKPLSVVIQGAAIGAGVELAAFAENIMATKKAWFQLPELEFGLIPGAGGTVSLTRRIGRHRTGEMALSGQRVAADTALDWGLVDQLA